MMRAALDLALLFALDAALDGLVRCRQACVGLSRCVVYSARRTHRACVCAPLPVWRSSARFAHRDDDRDVGSAR